MSSHLPKRTRVEKRLAEIDTALANVHLGQISGVAQWRSLLLEKEKLQQKLKGRQTANSQL